MSLLQALLWSVGITVLSLAALVGFVLLVAFVSGRGECYEQAASEVPPDLPAQADPKLVGRALEPAAPAIVAGPQLTTEWTAEQFAALAASAAELNDLDALAEFYLLPEASQ